MNLGSSTDSYPVFHHIELSENPEKPQSISPHCACRPIGMLQIGQTQQYVSQRLGVSRSVFSGLWTCYRDNGTVDRRPWPDRPRLTGPRDDRYLGLLVCRKSSPRLSTSARGCFGSSMAYIVANDTESFTCTGLRAQRSRGHVSLTAVAWRDRREWEILAHNNGVQFNLQMSHTIPTIDISACGNKEEP
ncbi:hypothetical protein ANN_10739 [Periplaneta americana]|uniref:Uncharacterized protein n=1 Tax=Periplaneta americana TaxID=6978 RepID=A0ABQ8T351_PERAM|nr:hypothetical protein ANN_10739 [Periplaneta americana]